MNVLTVIFVTVLLGCVSSIEQPNSTTESNPVDKSKDHDDDSEEGRSDGGKTSGNGQSSGGGKTSENEESRGGDKTSDNEEESSDAAVAIVKLLREYRDSLGETVKTEVPTIHEVLDILRIIVEKKDLSKDS